MVGVSILRSSVKISSLSSAIAGISPFHREERYCARTMDEIPSVDRAGILAGDEVGR
jgi:hypothetical protein